MGSRVKLFFTLEAEWVRRRVSAVYGEGTAMG